MKTTEQFLKDNYGDDEITNSDNLQFYIDLLERFANQSKWIDKRIELPGNGETVLVYSSEEINQQRIHITTFSNKYGFESVAERLVYAWQPLPEKP